MTSHPNQRTRGTRLLRFLFSSVAILVLTATIGSAASPELSPALQPALTLFNKGMLLEANEALNDIPEPDNTTKEFYLLKAMAKWKMMWLSAYSPEDREEVIELLDRVDGICLPHMNRDISFRFYHAAATGIRAQIAATEGDWWKTAKLGKQMKNHALQIVSADPEFHPAEYLLGSYNYFADALPGYLKFLRVLVFLPGGDRKLGLKQLIRAYEKGGITEVEAATTLSIIYTYYEQKFKVGNEMCDKVLEDYPESFDIALYKGINLYYLKDFDDSIEWLEGLRSRILSYSAKQEPDNAVVPLYRPMEREVRYWIARGKIQQEKWEEARELLQDLANPPIHQPYWLLRGVYLSLAQIDYHFNRPAYAEGRIAKVNQWEDVKDAHEKANRLKKKKGKIGTFDIDFL